MSIIINRCGIFIDIEGTSNRYEQNEIGFYQSLDCLLSSALKGVRFEMPKNNEFFLHQMGMDGLFLISRYDFESYEIPIAVSIYLMQKLLLSGSVGKCGISVGDNADIQSCLPQTTEQIEISKSSLYGGMMSKLNIAGTALINCHKLSNGKPRGSRIAVDVNLIPDNIDYYKFSDSVGIIDWLHTELDYLDFIYRSLNEAKPSVDELESKLNTYIENNLGSFKDCWVENTLSFNGMKISPTPNQPDVKSV